MGMVAVKRGFKIEYFRTSPKIFQALFKGKNGACSDSKDVHNGIIQYSLILALFRKGTICDALSCPKCPGADC